MTSEYVRTADTRVDPDFYFHAEVGDELRASSAMDRRKRTPRSIIAWESTRTVQSRPPAGWAAESTVTSPAGLLNHRDKYARDRNTAATAIASRRGEAPI
jgi:hypothetical protein